jgi:hypothetical protein
MNKCPTGEESDGTWMVSEAQLEAEGNIPVTMNTTKAIKAE